MPTSQLAGNRSRRARSPRDITGKEYARLHSETEAKKAAASIDVWQVQRVAFASGQEKGYADGFTAGWDALAQYLVDEGILEPDEPDEPDEDAE